MTVHATTPTPEVRHAPLAPLPARRSSRLARALALTPEILRAHAGLLPLSASRAVVSRAEVTSTGVAIVVLAPAGERLCCVIKIPLSPAAAHGMERETAVLAALHADDRLQGWRDLLPRPYVHGSLEGQAYRVDAALLGHPVLKPKRRTAARSALLKVAAETIGVLHRTTSTTVTGNDDLAETWVGAHVRELEHRAAREGSIPSMLRRLDGELRDAIVGRTFSAGWIHGDYWLGNLLLTSSGSALYVPRGIVDWDASAPVELALHDLLHLTIYTRRLLTGRQLGHIVREQLLRGGWRAEEDDVLGRYATWRDRGSLSERHALLLYWLRQVAMHARQQSSSASYRYRLWERRNVLPVLATLR